MAGASLSVPLPDHADEEEVLDLDSGTFRAGGTGNPAGDGAADVIADLRTLGDLPTISVGESARSGGNWSGTPRRCRPGALKVGRIQDGHAHGLLQTQGRGFRLVPVRMRTGRRWQRGRPCSVVGSMGADRTPEEGDLALDHLAGKLPPAPSPSAGEDAHAIAEEHDHLLASVLPVERLDRRFQGRLEVRRTGGYSSLASSAHRRCRGHSGDRG
jgi:hypothetical protein